MAEHPGFPNRATPLGSSAYYSVRLSPAPLQDALALLHAWHQTLDNVATEVSDPGVARLKLQWWREELERSLDGNPQHPLTEALAPLVEQFRLPATPFLEQADHVESRIRQLRPGDFQALEHWLEQGQGALAELLARCHGVDDEHRIRQARRHGGFWGGVFLLRDYGALRRQGFEPLPEGQTSPRAWGEHLQTRLPSPRDAAPLPPVIAMRSRILAVLLEEIADSDFAVEDQKIGLPPLRKLWLAWRCRLGNRFVAPT